MRFPIALLICLTMLCAAGAQQNSAPLPSHALTNQDVVRMTKASFGDATIVKMIETHGSSFDLSVDALLRLKELGVSQAVIQAMLSTDAERKPTVAAAPGYSGSGYELPCVVFSMLPSLSISVNLSARSVATKSKLPAFTAVTHCCSRLATAFSAPPLVFSLCAGTTRVARRRVKHI